MPQFNYYIGIILSKSRIYFIFWVICTKNRFNILSIFTFNFCNPCVPTTKTAISNPNQFEICSWSYSRKVCLDCTVRWVVICNVSSLWCGCFYVMKFWHRSTRCSSTEDPPAWPIFVLLITCIMLQIQNHLGPFSMVWIKSLPRLKIFRHADY